MTAVDLNDSNADLDLFADPSWEKLCPTETVQEDVPLAPEPSWQDQQKSKLDSILSRRRKTDDEEPASDMDASGGTAEEEEEEEEEDSAEEDEKRLRRDMRRRKNRDAKDERCRSISRPRRMVRSTSDDGQSTRKLDASGLRRGKKPLQRSKSGLGDEVEGKATRRGQLRRSQSGLDNGSSGRQGGGQDRRRGQLRRTQSGLDDGSSNRHGGLSPRRGGARKGRSTRNLMSASVNSSEAPTMRTRAARNHGVGASVNSSEPIGGLMWIRSDSTEQQHATSRSPIRGRSTRNLMGVSASGKSALSPTRSRSTRNLMGVSASVTGEAQKLERSSSNPSLKKEGGGEKSRQVKRSISPMPSKPKGEETSPVRPTRRRGSGQALHRMQSNPNLMKMNSTHRGLVLLAKAQNADDD